MTQYGLHQDQIFLYVDSLLFGFGEGKGVGVGVGVGGQESYSAPGGTDAPNMFFIKGLDLSSHLYSDITLI